MLKARTSMITAMRVAAGLLIPGYALAQNDPPSVGQLVATTKKQGNAVNMEQFKALVDKKEAGLIEFRIWKLAGFPDKTDMNRQMTLYCLTGGRCALATKSLQDLGFTNVTSVDMKFDEWVKAGYPVAKPAK